MKNLLYKLDANITPTKTNETTRTFLPSELYLPEWARDTEFFRCMTILLDYLQNSLKDISNPKYAMIEQAYKDIGFKYKDIMQTSEESLKAMLIENGFGKILEIFKLSLEQIQMLTLYLPLLKIMKGTDVGYRLFLSLFANEYEIETWLDNPQELEEYTFNILFISWINVGLSSDMVTNFIEFSRSYVYPILKKVEMGITYKSLAPAVYGYPKIKFDIMTIFNEEVVQGWTPAVQNNNLGQNTWSSLAWDGTKFIALSFLGFTSTSIDGVNWAVAVQNNNLGQNAWSSLAWDGTKFVAISFQGFTSTSIDGVNWAYAVKHSSLGSYYWCTLVYDGTKFVALEGSGAYTAFSTDGTTWTVTENIGLEPNTNWSLVYDGTKFVALGFSGFRATSIDGINWTTERDSNLGYKEWLSLAYDGTKFIALSSTGYTSISTNGIDWAVSMQDNNLGSNFWRTSAYDGTKFVALSETGYVSTYNIKLE